MNREWKDTFRFSLSLQMVGMAVLLVLSCTLLAKVYAGVISSSRHTKALNESVQISRNIAEAYTARPEISEELQLLADSGQDAGIEVLLSESVEDGLKVLTIQCLALDTEIYRLEVKVLPPTAIDDNTPLPDLGSGQVFLKEMVLTGPSTKEPSTKEGGL